MQKFLFCLILVSALSMDSQAQIIPQKFGKGIQFEGKDSSFYLKLGFRFQNLFVADWSLSDDVSGIPSAYNSNILVRRSRLKFDGWAHDPKITYKLELGLSNRDHGSGSSSEFRNTSNIILDASVAWNFYRNFTIQFGQRKLPGNRERVISSGNMQFVDRSQLNSRFNIDRDMGFQLKHFFVLGKSFRIEKTFAFSQGEGRNVTAGHFGGYDYTFKIEFLPFGKFLSNGNYIGSADKREAKPKLAVALSYDNNQNAVRERGQLGSFIKDANGSYHGKTLNTFFADLMFKHQGFSLMAEYAHRDTKDGIADVFDNQNNVIGSFYTGSAFNIQGGYMFDNNWEIAYRYTTVNPNLGVDEDETYNTLAISKFVVGHKLKIQTDFTYINNAGSQDHFIWRTQMDIHF